MCYQGQESITYLFQFFFNFYFLRIDLNSLLKMVVLEYLGSSERSRNTICFLDKFQLANLSILINLPNFSITLKFNLPTPRFRLDAPLSGLVSAVTIT